MVANTVIFFSGYLTIQSIIAIIKWYSKRNRTRDSVLTQSVIFLGVKAILPELFETMNRVNTQVLSYENGKSFKYIEMPDQKVYWIDRNRIYCADVRGGSFDPTEGKAVKTKNLSEDEVTKVLYIYGSLMNG
jgi:hypothetical protein